MITPFCLMLQVAGLMEVPFAEVQIEDGFWSPRRKINREVSIPHSLRMLEESGNVANFELAAKGAHTGYHGPVFMDSDLYKALEAASYSLAADPNPQLDKQVDALIAKIAAAQLPDGYLNTYYEVNGISNRLTNLAWNHELYCAGHMFEAAAAHFNATGKKNFLNIATKYADFLCATFGDGPGKREGYCGHPEIELALVKLWKATGERKYFDLARYFIEHRGTHFFAKEQKIPDEKYDGTYFQDDVPIFDQQTIKGHAVRAGYLMAGATDVAMQTRDPRLLTMLQKVWNNTTRKNLYLTGGIGPSASNEGFTSDYDLPNKSAYQETCASVAMILWNHRMGLLTGRAEFWDYVERALYNGFLAGVSLDGTKFFYVNPLSSDGNHHRSEWFSCACCPPNVTRTLACLGEYVYAKSNDALYVNLFIAGSVHTKVGENDVRLQVATSYPWSGRVVLKPSVFGRGRVAVAVRMPAWSSGVSATVDGAAVKPESRDGYLWFSKNWQPGDAIQLDFDFEPKRIIANPNVKEDAGKTAFQVGPIVYCLEGMDNPDLRDLYFPLDSQMRFEFRKDLLGGVGVVVGEARYRPSAGWLRRLYQESPRSERRTFVAVPYCVWDNRAPGPMDVWVPCSPSAGRAGGLESEAKVNMSFVSSNCQPSAINDGKDVIRSNVHPGALCHFWPHKGTEEWVEYRWNEPHSIRAARVYWFDDTGFGECRLPERWEIQYLENGKWKPVTGAAYPVQLDAWCTADFTPVRTTSLRLIVKLKQGWAAGMHEWKVIEDDD
jgi:DUF1680 family protein